MSDQPDPMLEPGILFDLQRVGDRIRVHLQQMADAADPTGVALTAEAERIRQLQAARQEVLRQYEAVLRALAATFHVWTQKHGLQPPPVEKVVKGLFGRTRVNTQPGSCWIIFQASYYGGSTTTPVTTAWEANSGESSTKDNYDLLVLAVSAGGQLQYFFGEPVMRAAAVIDGPDRHGPIIDYRLRELDTSDMPVVFDRVPLAVVEAYIASIVSDSGSPWD